MRTCSGIALLIGSLSVAGIAPPAIHITADRDRVGMGRVVEIKAQVTEADGTPAAGYRLLPYVDDSRWGAHKRSDARGEATFLLPLPRPGLHEIRVQVSTEASKATARWIWTPKMDDHQNVYLLKSFEIRGKVRKARLWLAIDDVGTAFLNGRKVATKGGWHEMAPVSVDPAAFVQGKNQLAVQAGNGTGPAGVVVRLEIESASGTRAIVSDTSWKAAYTTDAKWPRTLPAAAGPAKDLGSVCTHMPVPDAWPGILQPKHLIVGCPPPADAHFSNGVQVRVFRRQLETMPHDEDHLIGMQWEPWFTPHSVYWQTAEAVPIMGFYQSYDADVTRQHLIWMVESGVDFLFADWSNHIWTVDDWNKRAPQTNTIILATTLTLEVMASMREEGIPVPKLMLLTGISHAKNGVKAVNGELDWIYNNYIRNPRFAGLWQELYGKPLVTPLDLGAGYLKTKKPVDPDNRFTIRYVGAQQDRSQTHKLGLWSWMDCGVPQVTYFKGQPEAVTVSLGCFCADGWTFPGARGHRGGATLLETMQPALDKHPRVMLIHQFNEFAGQPEGLGHGPEKNHYYDTYSAELTDDCEPTSLDTPAYRSKGGWGFHYLNLVRAAVDLYKQPEPKTTLVVISSPRRRETVAGPNLMVQWKTLGRPPKGYTLSLDGKTVRQHLQGTSTSLDIRHLEPGPHTLTLLAEGTLTHYRLELRRAARRLSTPEPATVTLEFLR